MSNTRTTARIHRSAAAFAIAAVAAALVGAGTGVASADVPPATPSPTGDDIVPVGDLGACGGPIHVDRDTDRGRPGNLGITVTPRGGLGASPQCATTVQVDWINGIAPFAHTIQQPLDHGPIHLDVPAGAGVNLVTVSVLPQRAFAASNWVWIAP